MSSDKRHLLKSAYGFTQSGQWDRALEEYRRTAELFPEDPNIHSMIADLLVKKGDIVGGARSQMEAARLFGAQGNDEKELSSLRKVLRLQAGDARAGEALIKNIERSLVTGRQKLQAGEFDQAEALGHRLVEADPGNLEAGRLLDDIRAARLQEEARLQAESEARENSALAGDAAADVLSRLEGAVEAYFAAEDYENAVSTLAVMLKLDPGQPLAQARLVEAQARLSAAEQDRGRGDRSYAAQDLAEWRDEEEAVRGRIEEERRSAEDAARRESAVIEAAVRELKAIGSGQAEIAEREDRPAPAAELSAAPDSRPAGSGSGAAEARESFDAVVAEREELKRRLAEEKSHSADGLRQREEEMLRHAVEAARREAEAKAKEAALKELEERLAAERAGQRAALEEERRRMHEREQALQEQMKEFMRVEMERLQAEVRDQTLRELNAHLDDERRRRLALEEDGLKREREAEARDRAMLEKAEAERRSAEEAARKERAAVELLKRTEEARHQANLDEALKRRAARQGGGSVARAEALSRSRRISEVLHTATTRHLDADIEGMLATARRYLAQDLLLDAMRLCQKIAEKEPENERLKLLLKDIYQRKGI
jgi:tetratricopeptide (TPR) repeat protein